MTARKNERKKDRNKQTNKQTTKQTKVSAPQRKYDTGEQRKRRDFQKGR